MGRVGLADVSVFFVAPVLLIAMVIIDSNGEEPTRIYPTSNFGGDLGGHPEATIPYLERSTRSKWANV